MHLAGEFDLDGVVDVTDIMQVAGRWQCLCGDVCYEPMYDLDDDCDVDVADIMLVASRWQESCAWTRGRSLSST